MTMLADLPNVTPPRRAVGVLAALVWLALAAGCSDGDNAGTPGPIVGAPGPQTRPTAVCSGVPISGDNVIFVSPQGTDDLACGTYINPGSTCKTIWAALYYALPGLANVIAVRHGLYPTNPYNTIKLKDGVSIHGSCLFDGEPDRKYRTVIHASPAPAPPAITNAQVLAQPATLSGLVVISQDQTTSGAAGIAMALSGSTGLTLSNMVLFSGKGGDGAVLPVPPPQVQVQVRGDYCFTPGGARSELLWGPPKVGDFSWVGGAGGAGNQGGGLGAGSGGQQGGASIALLLLNSNVTVTPDSVRIIAGPGGNGADGQKGGTYSGVNGGGSGGAGGNGGPSIAVALRGSSPEAPSGAYLYSSLPSAAGAGGAGGVAPGFCTGDPGAAGLPGPRALVVNLDQGASILGPGQSLSVGQKMYGPAGFWYLMLGGSTEFDGNLAIWNTYSEYIWTSNTHGSGATQALMQADGNFCLLPGQHWCSGGSLRPGSYLIMRDDDTLQITDGVYVFWRSSR